MKKSKLILISTYRDGGSQKFQIEGTNVFIMNSFTYPDKYDVYLLENKERTELPKAEVVKRGSNYFLEEKELSEDDIDIEEQIKNELKDLFR